MKNENVILLSLRKKWWDLILSGDKRIELRKTYPKSFMGEPFTAYIYIPEEKAVCGTIDFSDYVEMMPSDTLYNLSLVTVDAQISYKKDGRLFGWNIQNAKALQKKPLSDFKVNRAPQSWQYVVNNQ